MCGRTRYMDTIATMSPYTNKAAGWRFSLTWSETFKALISNFHCKENAFPTECVWLLPGQLFVIKEYIPLKKQNVVCSKGQLPTTVRATNHPSLSDTTQRGYTEQMLHWITRFSQFCSLSFHRHVHSSITRLCDIKKLLIRGAVSLRHHDI